MSAKTSAVIGVSSVGFSTTQLLVAIAGATLCATMLSGWLKGVIAEIALSGSRIVKILRALPCGVRSQEKISPSSRMHIWPDSVSTSKARPTS
ncbi:hypothetical protein D3C87_1629860 [compost metagenome]